MTVRAISLAIFAGLMPVVLAAQTQLTIDRPSPDVVVFKIGHARYGSLEFDGSVERADMGDEWEFRTHLFATFHANTKPNQTEQVDLNTFRFVATIPRADGTRGPAQIVFKHEEAIDLHLDIDGERKPIPEVSFRVFKQVVGAAAFAEIGVYHSHGLAWPIPMIVNLVDPPFGAQR